MVDISSLGCLLFEMYSKDATVELRIPLFQLQKV